MSAPPTDQMESALAELRAQQERLRGFTAAMAARRAQATSKNRMVAAAVDSQGKLVELSLKGTRYRQLAPAELSALIVETVAKAQDVAAKETLAAAAALMPAGIRPPGLDVDAMVETAIRLAEQPSITGDAGGYQSGQRRDV